MATQYDVADTSQPASVFCSDVPVHQEPLPNVDESDVMESDSDVSDGVSTYCPMMTVTLGIPNFHTCDVTRKVVPGRCHIIHRWAVCQIQGLCFFTEDGDDYRIHFLLHPGCILFISRHLHRVPCTCSSRPLCLSCQTLPYYMDCGGWAV